MHYVQKKSISEIIASIDHRPWGLPPSKWVYYQEWNHVTFFHWKISPSILLELIPKELELDLFKGESYVSLVAFTMQKIRPKYFPSIKFVSDFHEINIRTYVKKENKAGVFFLNIEAEKYIATFLARMLSGLPYEKSNIKRINNSYYSNNKKKGFFLETEIEISDKINNSKSDLEKWLTERYSLYLNKNKNLYRYEIHHKEWEIKNAKIKHLKLNYSIGNLYLGNNPPDLVHFSDGVKVLAWKREKLSNLDISLI